MMMIRNKIPQFTINGGMANSTVSILQSIYSTGDSCGYEMYSPKSRKIIIAMPLTKYILLFYLLRLPFIHLYELIFTSCN